MPADAPVLRPEGAGAEVAAGGEVVLSELGCVLLVEDAVAVL